MSRNDRNQSRPAPRPAPESADPSPLYGLIFPRALRDLVFAKAVELFGHKPDERDQLVAADYRFLTLLEKVGIRMVSDAELAISDGTGRNQAYAPFWDFRDQVNDLVVVPSNRERQKKPRRDERPVRDERPTAPNGPTFADAKGGDKLLALVVQTEAAA